MRGRLLPGLRQRRISSASNNLGSQKESKSSENDRAGERKALSLNGQIPEQSLLEWEKGIGGKAGNVCTRSVMQLRRPSERPSPDLTVVLWLHKMLTFGKAARRGPWNLQYCFCNTFCNSEMMF